MGIILKLKKLLLKNRWVFQLHQRRRLKKILALEKPLKIHLGCGQDYFSGYINIDVHPGARADLIMDSRDLKLFPTHCAEVIESYHFLRSIKCQKY